MKDGENGQNKGETTAKKQPFFPKRFFGRIKAHKVTFIVWLCLQAAVLAALLFSLTGGRPETAVFCVLTLLLSLLPFFVEEAFRIEIPATLEIIILLFIFCSEMLGEAASFYVNFPLWDSLLHLVNGFLCAAVGFALTDLLNRRRRKFSLSPLFLTVVAFCFSMTVGVLWEFFEFFMDSVCKLDMQKDFLIDTVRSVLLDESRQNIVISVENIAKTVLFNEAGDVLAVIDGGFLDIGVIDTMKDLILNFFGALAFSFIGYFYVLHRGKGKFARQFIPTVERDKQPADNTPADKPSPTEKIGQTKESEKAKEPKERKRTEQTHTKQKRANER